MISFNSLVALVISCSSTATAEVARRCSTRAMQIIDANHVLKRIDETKGSFCLDAYPVRVVGIRVARVVGGTQSPLHRATRRQ